VESLEVEKNATLKDLEDPARLSEEFEDEYAWKARKMQMEVGWKANALKEVKEALSKKKEALKIAKVKEYVRLYRRTRQG
jgi:hypothetical protein